jgi:hypothetical protein
MFTRDHYQAAECGVQADWGLDGLAYETPHRLDLRRAGICVARMFAPYALDWLGDATWDIPAEHCFWTRLPAQVFLFGPHRRLMSTDTAQGVERAA